MGKYDENDSVAYEIIASLVIADIGINSFGYANNNHRQLREHSNDSTSYD